MEPNAPRLAAALTLTIALAACGGRAADVAIAGAIPDATPAGSPADVAAPAAPDAAPQAAPAAHPDAGRPTDPTAAEPADADPVEPDRAPAPAPAHVRWIAIGGGTGPEDNQVQIESDLTLARAALGPDGLVLYAGGPATRAVQVEDERAAALAARADPVLVALGDLIDPRGGRAARFRQTTLPVTAEASVERLTAALGRADGAMLTLLLAGHGLAGATPPDNEVALWGGDGLRPRELAPLIADVGRPVEAVRLILTTCFSGAFADLAFADADPHHGPAHPLTCGFFATSAVRVASGCDPDPERQHTEGYALHFFPALDRKDRDGEPLAAAEVDLDGDGAVSFAEAHAHARIASRGFDVPTATTARWLEVKAPVRGREAAFAWPEEEAVVRALGARLGLADRTAAEARRATLDAARERLATLADEAQADEDARAREAIGELLARWPALGDPWHPAFAATLAGAHGDLVRWLAESPRYEAYRAAHDVTAERAERADDAALEEAPVERLVAAYDNLARARRLKARGGPDAATFDALLACERGRP